MYNMTEEESEKYILAKNVAKYYNNRKVALWGDDVQLRQILKKHFNITVEFIVTIMSNIIDGKWIRNLSDINGKSEQYYLIAWGRGYDKKYHELLNQYGYVEKEDFIYRRIKPIVLEQWDCANGKYEDEYGNVIECASEGCINSITFRGYNNRICIGKNNPDIGNYHFDLYSNNQVIIGDNCNFSGDCNFEMIGYDGPATVYIDKNCKFADAVFKLFGNKQVSSIHINDSCTFGTNLHIHANSGKKVVIGRDCMFSFGIHLQAGDGHSIFDVKTRKNINSLPYNIISVKDQIALGEHVWVSANTFILNGTSIGNGSIIGANSTVKGIYPNNSVVAGNPAKLVKRDAAWSRYNCCDDITTCGLPEYVDTTRESAPAITGKNVLVIGGTRFMGVQLVKELLAKGNRVTIATRGKTNNRFGDRVNHIIMDLENPESVQKELSGKYYDVVFDNLAYCSNYVKTILSNVKCQRYIQLSSVEVYSPTKNNLQEKDFNPYILPQEWCGQEVGYQKGKQQAEAALYQKFSDVSGVTVRIPYVTKTDRLLYYCRCVIQQIPMNIDDTARGFSFVRDFEVGKFLPWIAAQQYEGPINLASKGFVTIQMILNYIEDKTGKKAIIDTKNGTESPFHVFGEKHFSMNLDKAEELGYHTSDLSDWFWKLMDEYIERAKKEGFVVKQKEAEEKCLTVNSIDKTKCTGCGACLNICPKDAIAMKTDTEGFLMPVIDESICIGCGLCKNICPTLEKESFVKEGISCYAMMASDELRAISSSGGAFTVIAEEIIRQGGVVCGATWTEGYNVEHQMVDCISDLEKLRGSKYVQSNTMKTYRQTKLYLDQGRKVLYTGMPCQIDGLYHYLNRDYENLITIDLLCRGIASNELFKKYITENYKNKKIEKISFKDKKPLGWGATTSYTFDNGSVEKMNIHNSVWMYTYLANIMDRNSCYSCKFNMSQRVADISIGDFWGIDKFNRSYNDTKGTSIVITSSNKGEELVQSIRNDCKLLEPVPLSHGVPHNSVLCSHVKPTPKRATLYENLKKMPFTAAVDRTIYGEKYKVGIVGWWYNLNYGGTLSYYSLNQAIQRMGYTVLMIRRSLWGAKMPDDNTIPMRFAKKYYNISRYYTPHDLHWLNYSCHAFVSGSDQLFNPFLQEYAGQEFFLSFVNEHNLKISYASSFGNIDSVPEDFKESHEKLLKRFNGISVRENYAVDLCKKDFDIDVPQVCDPIFLCDASEFKQIVKSSQLNLPEKYTMNFLLDPDEEKIKAYKFIREKLNIDTSMNYTDLQNVEERVKQFGDEGAHGNAEIEDFVNAYFNANFVVTDSFHGTCLAIIFNKPFISIANKSRGERRFISLLEGFNLLDRLVYDIDGIYNNPELLKPIDYTEVNQKISNLRKEGNEWLQNQLMKMV